MFKKVFLLLVLCLGLTACGGQQTSEVNVEATYSASGEVTVETMETEVLSNGSIKCEVDFIAPEGRSISIFNPPEGDKILVLPEEVTTGNSDHVEFEIPEKYVGDVNEIQDLNQILFLLDLRSQNN